MSQHIGFRKLDPDHAKFLRGIHMFELLGDEELKHVQSIGYVRDFRKGEVLFHEGDPGDTLYILVAGAIKVYRVTEEGWEKTIHLAGEGDFLGEMSLLDGAPRSATAECLDQTTCICIGRQDFQNLLDKNPKLSRTILEDMCKRLRATTGELVDVSFKDARFRLVKLLASLAERYGRPDDGGQVQIKLRLTHQDLANMISSKRETVTRILQEFQDSQAISIDNRHIYVKDLQSFKKWVGP
ncbi:MAG TPA: Crp/Fnr family transcriptional regulator [Candidatus Xenobia bacterium]